MYGTPRGQLHNVQVHKLERSTPTFIRMLSLTDCVTVDRVFVTPIQCISYEEHVICPDIIIPCLCTVHVNRNMFRCRRWMTKMFHQRNSGALQ